MVSNFLCCADKKSIFFACNPIVHVESLESSLMDLFCLSQTPDPHGRLEMDFYFRSCFLVGLSDGPVGTSSSQCGRGFLSRVPFCRFNAFLNICIRSFRGVQCIVMIDRILALSPTPSDPVSRHYACGPRFFSILTFDSCAVELGIL